MTMKIVNIAKLKNNFSKFLALVEKGEEVRICKRNIAIAKLTPIQKHEKGNHTKLGCGLGSVEIKGNLTDPMIPFEDWEMLKVETTS